MELTWGILAAWGLIWWFGFLAGIRFSKRLEKVPELVEPPVRTHRKIVYKFTEPSEGGTITCIDLHGDYGLKKTITLDHN